MTKGEKSDEAAAVEAAVELMKADRSPTSVKRALVDQGVSLERAEGLFEELRRLKEDQALADLDAELKKENAPPSLATHKKTMDRRSGFWMMIGGFITLVGMLRFIYLRDDWAPRGRPDYDNVPRLLLAASGVVLMLAGVLRRRGWF